MFKLMEMSIEQLFNYSIIKNKKTNLKEVRLPDFSDHIA